MTGPQAPTAEEVPPDFTLSHADEGRGIIRLAVSGELDLAVAPQFEQRVRELAGGSRCLRLDLSGLSFLDSSGIRALLGAAKLAEQQGCRLEVIRDLQPTVGRTLELTGVDAVLWPPG